MFNCLYCYALVLNSTLKFDSPTGYFQNPRIFNRCGDFCFVTPAGRVNDLFTVDKRMALLIPLKNVWI